MFSTIENAIKFVSSVCEILAMVAFFALIWFCWRAMGDFPRAAFFLKQTTSWMA